MVSVFTHRDTDYDDNNTTWLFCTIKLPFSPPSSAGVFLLVHVARWDPLGEEVAVDLKVVLHRLQSR